jgi:hypothetical protein
MKCLPAILLFLTLFISAGFNGLNAQREEPVGYDSISDRVLLKKELTGGLTLHVLGMGANIRKGVNKNFFTSRIFEVEMVSLKHPKQIRLINPYYYNAKSFVYGKLNHVYLLRAGFGYKKMLNRKPYWGGVELRVLYMGGITLGIAKPVYLYFYDETGQYLKEERYNPDNPYHDEEYIFGRAPYSNGLGELKLYPGLLAKAALNFEFGKLNSKIRALEAGGTVEFFPVGIPIMAFNPDMNLVFTLYLNFSLGKRYN